MIASSLVETASDRYSMMNRSYRRLKKVTKDWQSKFVNPTEARPPEQEFHLLVSEFEDIWDGQRNGSITAKHQVELKY